jgi:hypothetical protein
LFFVFLLSCCKYAEYLDCFKCVLFPAHGVSTLPRRRRRSTVLEGHLYTVVRHSFFFFYLAVNMLLFCVWVCVCVFFHFSGPKVKYMIMFTVQSSKKRRTNSV